jgi:hypothetical protein
MGIFRRTRFTKMSADRHTAVAAAREPELVPVAEIARPQDELTIESTIGSKDESDVFVCRRSSPELTPLPIAETAAAVTLFVFGWHNVEPGPLSWPFPSLRTALDAVRTMRNAAQWCICSGDAWSDMDAARAAGAVLIEQLG